MFDADDMEECLEDMENDEEPMSIEEYTMNRGFTKAGSVDFSSQG